MIKPELTLIGETSFLDYRLPWSTKLQNLIIFQFWMHGQNINYWKTYHPQRHD